jgi:hypothetical protein
MSIAKDDDFNEEAFLMKELQWRQMRFREAQAEMQVRTHELNEINQAVIDYFEGKTK